MSIQASVSKLFTIEGIFIKMCCDIWPMSTQGFGVLLQKLNRIREQRQKWQQQKSQLFLRSLGMDMMLNGGTSS